VLVSTQVRQDSLDLGFATDREARQNGISVKTFTVLMHDVHRAICDGEEDGFVKIHVQEGSDTILGATVVGRHAGEMINDISLAIQSGIGLAALGRVIRPYPTQAAAIQMAADAFNRGRFGDQRHSEQKPAMG
jgi:pyruvate/2-oxoglutarate dehydrogenase complex dihydrolipoamide dehydrogenase (E3) component